MEETGNRRRRWSCRSSSNTWVCVCVLCFGVTGVKYPTWAIRCLRVCETDLHVAWKHLWDISMQVFLLYIWGFQHYLVSFSVSQRPVFSLRDAVFHPDRQNIECLVIKEQRNPVWGSHAASVYPIITDRQREHGAAPGLHCSWGAALHAYWWLMRGRGEEL